MDYVAPFKDPDYLDDFARKCIKPDYPKTAFGIQQDASQRKGGWASLIYRIL